MNQEVRDAIFEIFAENEKRLNEMKQREQTKVEEEAQELRSRIYMLEAPTAFTGNEVVTVVGMPDISCEGIDFMKSCLLNESLEIVKDRYGKLTDREKRFYYISVCQGVTPIYSLYQDKFIVEGMYKDYISVGEEIILLK